MSRITDGFLSDSRPNRPRFDFQKNKSNLIKFLFRLAPCTILMSYLYHLGRCLKTGYPIALITPGPSDFIAAIVVLGLLIIALAPKLYDIYFRAYYSQKSKVNFSTVLSVFQIMLVVASCILVFSLNLLFLYVMLAEEYGLYLAALCPLFGWILVVVLIRIFRNAIRRLRQLAVVLLARPNQFLLEKRKMNLESVRDCFVGSVHIFIIFVGIGITTTLIKTITNYRASLFFSITIFTVILWFWCLYKYSLINESTILLKKLLALLDQPKAFAFSVLFLSSFSFFIGYSPATFMGNDLFAIKISSGEVPLSTDQMIQVLDLYSGDRAIVAVEGSDASRYFRQINLTDGYAIVERLSSYH